MRLPRVTVVVLIGLLGLSAMNLAFQRWHEPIALNPLVIHEDAELDHLLRSDRPSVRQRTELYLDLRTVGAGGELIAPPRSGLIAADARVLAEMTLTVDERYDPQLDDDETAALRERPGHAGEFWRDGVVTYLVVEPVEPADAARFRVFVHDGDLLVADEHTLDVLGVTWEAEP